MLYFDTSFVIPLIRSETSSARISAFFAKAQADKLAVSQWTHLETSSALARWVRMGELTADAAVESAARFDTLVDEFFEIFLPDTGDYELAAQYLRRFDSGVRAGDALHLAIAANRGASAIYTLDKALMAAGKILRLPVKNGNEP